MVKSFKVFLDNLAKYDVTPALTKACLLVERDAKQRCPVDTGELRQSITSKVKDNIGYIGSNLDYSVYVEYGTGLFAANGDGRKDVPWHYMDAEGNWHTTSGMHPQPYLVPALESNVDAINKIFEESLRSL